jgi:hypothetical protein
VAIKAGGWNDLREDDSNRDEDRAAVIHAISRIFGKACEPRFFFANCKGLRVLKPLNDSV